jgi:hypothetical protein
MHLNGAINYQTSYPYKTLATWALQRKLYFKKRTGKILLPLKTLLYLPVIKNQTFYYEQS